MALYCVEIGTHTLKNLSRMTSSVVVSAKTPAEAVSYVEGQCPELVRLAAVQRVFEAEHVIVDWPSGDVAIIERK